MNRKMLGAAVLAVAAVAVAAMFVGGAALSADLAAADDYAEDEEEQMTGAGGGGWFRYDGAKNTFGFYLNASDESMSEFVLQARSSGLRVQAYQFDAISFAYDADTGTGSAEARGRAWVNGADASFHLIVEDNGPRDMDRLWLEVAADVTTAWDIAGLGGGQIWVYLE